MKHAVTRIAVILAAATLTGCGSDGEDDPTDVAPDDAPTAPSETCAESFNADAPDTFPRLIRLSHADGAAILTGTFPGPEFTAPIQDTGLELSSDVQTVETGACVVTEPSDPIGVLYVFAVGADGLWHRFYEFDAKVPFAKDPAQLEDIVEVTLEEGQTSDVPNLVPIG